VRNTVFWLAALLALGSLNWIVVGKERVLRDGETMYLKLAPRDPRSLIQGDYMVLRYAIAAPVGKALPGDEPTQGAIVVTIDERGVATFVRIHAGEPLAGSERLLRFKRRGRVGAIRLGAESFFFQEGHAELYAEAEFGELKVEPSGASVLVGLRDEQLAPLGPPR
jgi:uncharacterized membrane-anchored protein